MKNKIHFVAGIFILMCFGSEEILAQTDSTRLKQEVEVNKAYQPSINEVFKINDLPKVKPEPTEPPVFDYSIYSKPVFSKFDVKPVAAAKMVGEPGAQPGKGLLKLGLGNYLTPYGELHFNAQPGDKSNFGMHFKHLSSSGKIKLLNDDKVEAPRSENIAEIYGKHFYKKSTLSGTIGYERLAWRYYGYSGRQLTDELKDQMIPYFQDKQYFSKGRAEVRLKSETLQTDLFNYDFRLNYHYLKTKTGQNESQFSVLGDVKKEFGNMLGLLHASVSYYKVDSIWNNTYNAYGQKNQIMFRANPSVSWSNENSSLELGLNTTIFTDEDTDAAIYLSPKIKAEWSPIPTVLTLFAGVDNFVRHNTYSSIATENPYVDPFHDVANTNYKYIFSGGLKGKLTAKTNYVAKAAYSIVENQHFFIINGTDISKPGSAWRRLNNTFNWVYDEVNILNLSGEVLHSVSDHFSFHLLGNYYAYEPENQEKAWQLPNFDLTISGEYKVDEHLKFTSDLYVKGKKTALVKDYQYSDLLSSAATTAEIETEISPVIDLNLGVEYRFSDKINLFLNLNNFGFQKYEEWLGYTNKGFNWLAGISYSF